MAPRCLYNPILQVFHQTDSGAFSSGYVRHSGPGPAEDMPSSGPALEDGGDLGQEPVPFLPPLLPQAHLLLQLSRGGRSSNSHTALNPPSPHTAKNIRADAGHNQTLHLLKSQCCVSRGLPTASPSLSCSLFLIISHMSTTFM